MPSRCPHGCTRGLSAPALTQRSFPASGKSLLRFLQRCRNSMRRNPLPDPPTVDIPSPATDILPGWDLINPPNWNAFADNVAFLHPKQWSSALGLILKRLMAHNEDHTPSLSLGSPLLVIKGYTGSVDIRT